MNGFKNKIVNKSVRFFSLLVFLLERKNINDTGLSYQPIFIIGAPRTGSTILYQALTNYYNVSYIDNYIDRWHKSLFYGFKRSYRIFGNQPHNVFNAEYGSTSMYSEHAPSECGNFWYRWLPRERHFIDANEISKKSKYELYYEVCSITNYFKKPILFKNLNAGQRLRFIKEVFPNAKFIYIKRDHEKVKSSILSARKKLNISKNQIWSIKPKNFIELSKLPEETMVIEQIRSLEKQIEQDLVLFDDVFTLHFDDLSEEKIVEIGAWLNLAKRHGGCLPVFKKDSN